VTRARTAGALTASVVLASGCGLLQHSASLTFQVGNVECSPAKSANALGQVCSFLAFYGNISKHPIQVEPATTTVLDKTGKSFLPTADNAAGTFLLKPGQQQQVSWSVALPQNTRPTKVQWHGSAVDVQFQVPGAVGPSGSAAPSAPASAQPSAVAPSTTPSTAVAPTTPVPTSAAPTTTTPTTTKPVVKPSKTTTKPTKTPAAPTTTPVRTTTPAPTTTPPPRTHHTTPPPVHHTTPAPTTANSTNPGGGIGHIG
jgi:hypothetical protein